MPKRMVDPNQEGKEAMGKLADFLTLKIKELMKSAKTEEELRIGFEKALDHIRTAFGITGVPRYERHDKATVFLRDRPDAVHGRIVVEYEPPRSLRSERNINHATDQLVRYMMNEAGIEKGHELEALEKLVGIGLDGERIFFIRYRNGSSKGSFALEEIRRKILITGPYELGEESIRLFLTHLRALSRLPLSPERLAERFGPKGTVAAKLVPALVNGLKDWRTPRITTFFEEWRRLFGIVYGEAITARQAQESKILQELYGVRGDPSFQELLFAVHTYFALLMKV